MPDLRMAVLIDASGARAGARALKNALNSIIGDTKKAEKGFNKLNRGLGNFSKGLFGFKGILGGISLGLITNEAVQAANALALMEGRLKLVTNSSEELAVVQKQLLDVANSTSVSFLQTADLYQRIARTTKQLSVSQSELVSVTQSINKALTISGASAQSAAAALVQLGQGFSSGTLRGQELNSVMEQTPRVAELIADGMGIAVGELRDLGEQGKLTAEEVFFAILRQKEAIDAEFAQMPDTVSRAFTRVANTVQQAMRNIDVTAAAESIEEFRMSLERLQVVEKVGSAINTLVGILADFANAVLGAVAAIPTIVDEIIDWTVAIVGSAGIVVAVSVLTNALHGLNATMIVTAGLVSAQGILAGFGVLAAVLKTVAAAAAGLWAALAPFLAPAGLIAFSALVIKTSRDIDDLTEALDDNAVAINQVWLKGKDLLNQFESLDDASYTEVSNIRERTRELLNEALARAEASRQIIKQSQGFKGFMQAVVAAGNVKIADVLADPGAFFRGETLETPIRLAREQLEVANNEVGRLEGMLKRVNEEASKFPSDPGFVGPVLPPGWKPPEIKPPCDKECQRAIKSAADEMRRAREEVDDLIMSLEMEQATFGKTRSEVIAYDAVHGKLAKTLNAAGIDVDTYRQKIIELGNAIDALAIEERFGDPQAVFDKRIASLDRLKLSEMARANAIREANDALFDAREAQARLTSEEQANIDLRSAQLQLMQAEITARQSLGLDTQAQTYAATNELIRDRIAELKKEIALWEKYPDSITGQAKILELKAAVLELSASIRDAGDDVRMAFQDGMAASIESVLNGTATMKDAFKSLGDAVLAEMNRIFAKEIAAGFTNALMPNLGASRGGGTGSFLGDIFGGLFGQRQFGGPAISNRPYLVGEGGKPEVFIPGTSGQIIPDANVGGVVINMTINTPDANSFRASQDMIARDMSARIAHARRFQG